MFESIEKLENGQFIATQQPIQPNSPIRDYFCNMHYDGNRLLVAGGDLNYNSIEREGTAMYYENNTWHNFSEENITSQTNLRYIDLTSIAQDPNDPTHHYVGSARQGLYEFKDLQFIKKYDYTNSVLRTILPDDSQPLNFVSCDALQYDANGNLWMVNNEVDTILVVLKADNTWTKLYFSELRGAPNSTYIYFDSKGRLWLNSKRLSSGGIFMLDFNSTVDDTSDDMHVFRQTIVNQDGVVYDPDYYNCFVQDLNGQIWIGTSSGLFVIEDNAQAMGATYISKSAGTFPEKRSTFSEKCQHFPAAAPHEVKTGTESPLSCTSFFPTKNLACLGDGGAITTDDDALAGRALRIPCSPMEPMMQNTAEEEGRASSSIFTRSSAFFTRSEEWELW